MQVDFSYLMVLIWPLSFWDSSWDLTKYIYLLKWFDFFLSSVSVLSRFSFQLGIGPVGHQFRLNVSSKMIWNYLYEENKKAISIRKNCSFLRDFITFLIYFPPDLIQYWFYPNRLNFKFKWTEITNNRQILLGSLRFLSDTKLHSMKWNAIQIHYHLHFYFVSFNNFTANFSMMDYGLYFFFFLLFLFILFHDFWFKNMIAQKSPTSIQVNFTFLAIALRFFRRVAAAHSNVLVK